MIIFVFVIYIFLCAGCNPKVDNIILSSSGTSTIQEETNYINEENIIEEHQIYELRKLLSNRINGSNNFTGYYNEISQLIPNIKLTNYTVIIDNISEEYFYAVLQCGNRKYILCFDSDEKNQPSLAQGLIVFTNIIDSQALSASKTLNDIYEAEKLGKNNTEDYYTFWEHLYTINTMICAEFDDNSQYLDSQYAIYCTDNGLFAVEYPLNNTIDNATKFEKLNNIEIYKPNFNCSIRGVSKYNEKIFSEAYKHIYNSLTSQ